MDVDFGRVRVRESIKMDGHSTGGQSKKGVDKDQDSVIPAFWLGCGNSWREYRGGGEVEDKSVNVLKTEICYLSNQVPFETSWTSI